MVKKKKKDKEFEEEEEDEGDDDGCCPDTHAKCFELVLIVGFLLGIAALTVNLVLNLWFFKLSLFLFIFTIVPMALNLISFIISIILRNWRSDNSVFKKNFSSSSSAACFLLVILIINFLSTAGEIVFYYFVYNYLSLQEDDENCEKQGSNCNPDELKKKLEAAKKIYYKIMNKCKGHCDFGIDDLQKLQKKTDMVKLLPWAAFCLNLFIQFLMIIMDCIIMGRIKLKSHFGFPEEGKNKSSKNKMIDDDYEIKEKKGVKKKGKKKKKKNGADDLESDITIIKNKKTKKKKKKGKSTRKKIN